MKKILLSLSILSIIVATTANLIDYNIGDITGEAYFEKLEDYDWTDEFGDRLNFDIKNIKSEKMDNDEIIFNPKKPENIGNYINYKNFNTGYQWETSIKKQAVTGAPTSKIFMPNGNKASDFGVTSKAEKFSKLNSFLNWDPKIDKDAYYNSTNIIRSKTSKVALPWAPTQNENVKHNLLGFTDLGHRAAVSSNVGIKNPFNNNFTNYQYLNQFTTWGGSFFEGLIKIPSAEAIEAAHINGSKVYGNVFLDGYHGLSKKMLIDFLSKDDNNNFKVSKILYDMALYFGFDGYFWNNESNGGLPNGTVLDYKNILQMFNEMKKINKKNNTNIENIFYSSYSNLSYNSKNKPINYESFDMSKIADEVQQDFGIDPENINKFLSDPINIKWKRDNNQYKIYNMIEGAATSLLGIYDARTLTTPYRDQFHNLISDDKKNELKTMNNSLTFSGDPLTSLTLFEDNGGAAYGGDGMNIVKESDEYKKAVEKNLMNEAKLNLFGQQISNIADDLTYTGRNRFLRGYAYEADPKYDKKYENKISWINDKETEEFKINSSVDEDYGVTNNGWNGGWTSGINRQAILKSLDIMPDIESVRNFKYNNNLSNDQKRWLFAKDKNDNYVYSFGIGNIVQENTVLNDDNPKDIITNFSTGNGIVFVNDDDSFIENYPWSNKRLMDIQPTYKWDIKKYIKNEKQSNLENFSQKKLSGFYDYYHPYRKGNSIALGKRLNIDGSIVGTDFKKNESVIWNIMGTKFDATKINKNINFKIKSNLSFDILEDNDKNIVSKNIDELFDVKLGITYDDFNIEKRKNANDIDRYKNYGSIEEIELDKKVNSNGWNDYFTDLNFNKLNTKGKNISKISLIFTPKKNISNYLINIGEFNISQNDNKLKIENKNEIKEIKSEYVITRKNDNNIRFKWKSINDNDVKYYEIYLIINDENGEKRKIRVGETTQTAYYIKEIPKEWGIKIGIKPIFKKTIEERIYVQEFIL